MKVRKMSAIRSIYDLNLGTSVQTFSLVACFPRKVHERYMTSDSDVCEVNVDVQMSFLNVELLSQHSGDLGREVADEMWPNVRCCHKEEASICDHLHSTQPKS